MWQNSSSKKLTKASPMRPRVRVTTIKKDCSSVICFNTESVLIKIEYGCYAIACCGNNCKINAAAIISPPMAHNLNLRNEIFCSSK